MQTFDGAVKFLKRLPQDIDEASLFSVIDGIFVSWSQYEEALEAQKVAQINTQIHQALL